jgi:transposase InsO family protein
MISSNTDDKDLLPRETPMEQKVVSIYVPDSMLNRLILWYHESVAHSVGATRLYKTLSAHFYYPKLRDAINAIVYNCDTCQRQKVGGRSYSELPPREAPLLPWQEIHVDCIGPWPVEFNGQEYAFNALTVIDPVTNLLEIYRLRERTSYRVANEFTNGWIARYPRATRCVHDQGKEFTGSAFQTALSNAGIESCPITTKNPQSNGLVERVHQAVAQILRTIMRVNPPDDVNELSDVIDSALATAMHATRCSASRSLAGHTPGALAFHRDMFLDVPLISDLLILQ